MFHTNANFVLTYLGNWRVGAAYCSGFVYQWVHVQLLDHCALLWQPSGWLGGKMSCVSLDLNSHLCRVCVCVCACRMCKHNAFVWLWREHVFCSLRSTEFGKNKRALWCCTALSNQTEEWETVSFSSIILFTVRSTHKLLSVYVHTRERTIHAHVLNPYRCWHQQLSSFMMTNFSCA